MRVFLSTLFRIWVVALGFVSVGAMASVFNVTVDTGFLNGSPSVLGFDFIDGGSPSNSVTLSSLTANGTIDATSITGDVTGTGPWMFADSSLFNELLVAFNPTGSSLTFSFSTSDNAADPGSSPDAFSFFVLATDLITPLITTNDPTGANALFLFSLGQGAAGLAVYSPEQAGFSIEVAAPQSIPEPSTIALLAAALLIVGRRKRLLKS